jgi:hypothetical protein
MNPAVWLILGGIIVILVIYRRVRESRHLAEIASGVPRIQQAAFEHVGLGNDLAELQAVAARQSFTTLYGFRLIYTCNPTEAGGMTHHLSGQMQRPNRKELAMNMLLAMAFLVKQFEEAAIDDRVKFQMEESDLGTQHLEFTVTDAEHAALRRVAYLPPRERTSTGTG